MGKVKSKFRWLAVALSALILFLSVPVEGVSVYADEVQAEEEIIDNDIMIIDETKETVSDNNSKIDPSVSDNGVDGENERSTSEEQEELITIEEQAQGYRITHYSNGELTISGAGKISIDDLDDLGNLSVKKIIIEEGITGIESSCFCSSNFTDLEEVILPSTLKEIGSGSFEDCKKLININFPKGVTIGFQAFRQCSALETVTIPDDTIIGSSAFSKCTGLKSVSFGNNITVGSYAFEDCKKIKNIDISKVKLEGNHQFSGCVSITEVCISEGCYASETFYGCTGLVKAIVSDGVELSGTFCGCTNLKEIELGEKVTIGGYNTFAECASLEHIKIPESIILELSSYGDSHVFYGCTSLKTAGPIGGNYNIEYGWKEEIPCGIFAYSELEKVVIPNGIKKIERYAFRNSKVKEVIVPNSVSEIGNYAFSECKELEHLVIPSVNLSSYPGYYPNPFWGCEKLITAGPIGSDSDFEYGWIDIPSYGFADMSIESISFPSNLKSIGESAFYSCKSLKKVRIPDSIKTISNAAFTCCSSLERVELNKTEVIEPNAFTYCESLSEVVTNDNLKRIGSNAFFDCKSLKSFYMPDSFGRWDTYTTINPFLMRVKDEVTGEYSTKSIDLVIICNRNTYAYEWADYFKFKIQVIGEESIDVNGHNVTISFDANGGTGSNIQPITIGYNSAKKLAKCTFKRNGYEFLNWNTDRNGTGTSYSDEATIFNSVDEDRTMTLYAQWKKIDNASQIKYELNGGANNADNPSSVQWGKTFTLLNPTRNGYKFAGWYGDSKFRVKLAKVIGKQGINYTLYAKWTPNTYKVKYVNPKGAVTGKNPTSYKPTDATKILQPAVRKGYAFTGWYTDVNLTNKITQINSGSYGDITLYSGWTASSYTIVYNGNGSTGGSTPDSYHQYMTRGAISENGYTKTGYTFSNWYKNAKCTGTAYKPGYSKNDLAYIDGTIVTLYAKWIANNYVVVYDGNGATSGKTANSKFTYDKKGTIAGNGFKRDGYEFSEWNTKPDGTGKTYKAKANGIHNLTTGTGAVTLYAQWKPILRVTYDGNGSTGGSVKPTILKYGTKNTLASNNFNRTGYIFVEWNTRADGSGKAYKAKANSNNELISDDPEGNTTLYAQWKPITYNIRLMANTQNPVIIQAKYDTNVVLPTSPFTRKGFTFDKWVVIDGLGTHFADPGYIVRNLRSKNGDKVDIASIWTYKVYYDANGGSGYMEPSTFVADGNVKLAKNTFTKDGYVFAGWKYDKLNSAAIGTITMLTSLKDEAKVKNLVNTDGSPVTLKAFWVPESREVSYYANTGNASYDKSAKKEKYTYDQEYTIHKNFFKRKGYVFDSWNTSPNGDGTRYEVGQKVVNPPSKLYAFWEEDIKVAGLSLITPSIEVTVGDKTDLNPYVIRNSQNPQKTVSATNSKLTWKVINSDNRIATIDATSGMLHALNEGTIVVRATSKTTVDGKERHVDINIRITNYDYDAELEQIRDWIRHPQEVYGISWNVDKYGKRLSVDCNWFAKYKLYKRGLFSDKIEDTYPSAGKYVQSDKNYEDWSDANKGKGFAKATSEYLKIALDKNNGQPLYNIYIRDDTKGDPHSVLIDKVYYDNGVMMLILSDNHAGDMITRDDGDIVPNITDRLTYTSDGFIDRYKYRHGNPDVLSIFGPNKPR